MQIKRATAHSTEPGPKDWFSGTVWLDEIAIGVAPSMLRVHAVTFEPGARTAWHTHPMGQVLHVLAGVGRVQEGLNQVRQIGPGDTVSIKPGERHWHGAAPDRLFVHLAIQEARADGNEAEWFEQVTKEEYESKPELPGTSPRSPLDR